MDTSDFPKLSHLSTTRINLKDIEAELTNIEDALLPAYRLLSYRTTLRGLPQEVEQVSNGLDAVLNLKQAFGFYTAADPFHKRQIAQTTTETFVEHKK